MVNRILILIYFIMASISIGGCARPNLPLTITIDQSKIDFIKLQEISNDNKNIFIPAFEKDTAIEIRYVKIGKEVTLDFEYNFPDKVTIQEIFLNATGEMLYTDNEIKNIPFTQEKNKCFFTIEESIVSGLSSVYFIGKTDLRGYKITTFTGKDMKVYICVIRTDSG